MPKPLRAVRLLVHVMPRPEAPELLTLHRQLADQLGEVGIVGVSARCEAQVGDGRAGALVPVRVQPASSVVEEEVACRVALLGRQRAPIDQQRRVELVPREDIHAAPDHHRGDAVERVDQPAQRGADPLGSRPAAPGRPAEVVEMGPLGVAEPKGAGDRVEHALGGLAGAALLEPHVVVHADPGQQGELLAAQARHAPPPVGMKSDLLGLEAGPSRLQELAELAALVHVPSMPPHDRLRVALRVPGAAGPWLTRQPGGTIDPAIDRLNHREEPSMSTELDYETDAGAGRAVTFDSHGETVVGRLFPAALGEGPAPAVAVIGPETYQKEQAPTQYAARLAQLGYTALVFDPRYRGESGGEPRCYEDPVAKQEDLGAALDYLSSLPDVDGGRLVLLGICFGGSYALPVAAEDQRVQAVATVAAHLRDRPADIGWLGSEAVVAERLARGQEALERYRATGEVEYVPAVDAVRADVGMPGRLPWSWYQLWADRGLWENRYAVMSDAAVLSFESLGAAARLTTPVLMIHSDQCAQPEAARRHFAVIPTADKKLLWEGQTRHLQYYDDPAVIDRAVWSIADWFGRHLGQVRQDERHARTVQRFFELLGRKDIDAWGALWHERARLTTPYTVEGFASTIVGRAEIVAAFRALFANFETFRSELAAVYPASDSHAVCVEYRNRATLAGGSEYTNENIAVFHFRDGLVSDYHDYFDPRRFQVVVDALADSAARPTSS
jgi:uncharacterized protein